MTWICVFDHKLKWRWIFSRSPVNVEVNLSKQTPCVVRHSSNGVLQASCVTCCGRTQTRTSRAGERMTAASPSLLERMWSASSSTATTWTWSAGLTRFRTHTHILSIKPPRFIENHFPRSDPRVQSELSGFLETSTQQCANTASCYQGVMNVLHEMHQCWEKSVSHDVDLCVNTDRQLLCVWCPQVVEDGYEFFAKRQLVTLFSAPNYCGEFDNAGGMMSVDETLMCSFQVWSHDKVLTWSRMCTEYKRLWRS